MAGRKAGDEALKAYGAIPDRGDAAAAAGPAGETEKVASILSAVAFLADCLLDREHSISCIDDTLKMLGEATGSSRTQLFRKVRETDEEIYISLSNEWVAPGIQPQIGDPLFQEFPCVAAGFSRCVSELRSGRVVASPVSKLPECERKVLQSHGLMSLLMLPLSSRDAGLIGFMSFDDCARERTWSDLEMVALRTAAHAFGEAIHRIEIERRLIANERLIEVVLDSSLQGIIALRAVRSQEGEIIDFEHILANDYAEGMWRRSGIDSPLLMARLAPFGDQGIHAMLATTVETGIPTQSVYSVDSGAGTRLSFDVRAVKLEDGVAVFVNEITSLLKVQDALEDYQNSLRKLSIQITIAEEKERKRIAEELHDNLGQLLVVAKMDAEKALRCNEEGRPARTELARMVSLLSEGIRQTRALTTEFSALALYELGLVRAIEKLVDDLPPTLVAGCETSFHCSGGEPQLPDTMKVLLYRSVSELLLNAAKHSKASFLSVHMASRRDVLEIMVSDDGVGFDPDKALTQSASRECFGLFAVRERLKHLDGTMTVESSPRGGTTITLLVPLAHPAGGSTEGEA
jgi:signal transduction histidine kinase